MSKKVTNPLDCALSNHLDALGFLREVMHIKAPTRRQVASIEYLLDLAQVQSWLSYSELDNPLKRNQLN